MAKGLETVLSNAFNRKITTPFPVKDMSSPLQKVPIRI